MMPAVQDKPFQHYSLKHQAIAWISQNLFDGFVYTARHGLLKGMKRKGGLGWVPRWAASSAETPEERFWRSLDLAGKTVFDVGAFHGLVTLFFSRTARQVISYEPNSANRARLRENLKLNSIANVVVRPVGLGSEPGTAEMVYDPKFSGGATLEQSIGEPLRQTAGARTEQLQITTLDIDIGEQRLPRPDFIKIDVEGWELEVLKGARGTLSSTAPDLFLEMHGQTMNEKKRKVAEVVEFLTAEGYRDIRHVESGTAITPANSEVAARGHLYCRRTG
jgi:FkbM family methyltransferase